MIGGVAHELDSRLRVSPRVGGSSNEGMSAMGPPEHNDTVTSHGRCGRGS